MTASFFSSVTNPNKFGGKNRKMNVLSLYSLGRNPNQRSGLEDLLSQLRRDYSSGSYPNQGGGEKQRDFFTDVLIPIKEVVKEKTTTKRIFSQMF